MEEKKFSPEQSEEVIELLDIVAQSESDKAAGQEEELVLTGGSGRAEQTENPASRPAEGSREQEEDVVLLSEEAVLAPAGQTDDAGAFAESVESEDACKAEAAADGQSGRSSGEEAESGQSPLPAEEDEPSALKQKYEAKVQEMEERIAVLEKSCRELSESVESLGQQIAQAGTMFLEDASVRLNMEELVSRMLDARLPSTAEQEENASAGEIVARVDALEKRVQEWEDRSEQTAASAAARVIREEIAAMKAETVGGSR